MSNNTDTMWRERLEAAMPANFMNNIDDKFVNETIYNTMMKMIGRTVVHNPDNMDTFFSEYVGAVLDYGDTIQEFKVKIAEGYKHQPTEAINNDAWDTDPYKIVKNPPIAQYEKINDGTTYKATLHTDQLRLAFNSEQRFGDFMASLTSAVYEADNLDKFIKFKKYLSNADLYKVKENVVYDASDNKKFYENLLKAFMKYPKLMKLPSKNYNLNEDLAKSNGVDIIMRAEDRVELNKDILAGVYNLSKVEIDADIKEIDDFATVQVNGEDKKVAAIIIDKRFAQYNPRTPIAGSIYNPEGAYTNITLHIQGIYSVAKFRNAIMLLDERP